MKTSVQIVGDRRSRTELLADIELAAAIGLTTVRQPSLTQGRHMASVLLDILAGRPAVHATILPTEIVERASA